MKIRESDLEIECSNKMLVLPFFNNDGSNVYSTDSINCVKFLRGKLDIDFYAKPDGYWEQRSIDWLGPILFVSGKLLSDYPDLLNVLFDSLSYYIKNNLPSREATVIKMKVVCKKDEDSKTMEIDYEGDLKGLRDIRGAIESVFKD